MIAMASSGPWSEVSARLLPGEPVHLTLGLLGGVVLVAAVAVLVPPVWRALRIGVTLVHELGHAFVGMLCGRKFTGFVLRGDMSGHALTAGPDRGLGRVVTTWAGYPMPGIVALAFAWVASRGYAAAALAAVLLALVVALPRVRSLLTVVVVLLVGAAVGALWWWRDDALQAQAVVGVALVLLVGAWRHLGAVVSARGSRSSDPAVLRRLTGIPVLVWNLTFALALAACTYGTWRVLAP